MEKKDSRLRSNVQPIKISNKRNIYIANSDQKIWESAETYAREHNVSLSSLIAEALAKYLLDNSTAS